MKLTLSEEQALIADSVRDFLSAEYDFTWRARSLRAPHACDPRVWQRFAELGWLALTMPEGAGGLGAGAFEAGLLMRVFGRHLVVEPYAAHALLAAPLLAAGAPTALRQEWLPALADGTRRAALAHDENVAPAPWQPRSTIATRTTGGWVLRGRKDLVSGAAGADLLLVSASAQDEGNHRLFAVAPQTAGVRVEPAATAAGSSAADVVLDDVRVDEGSLVGGDTDAAPALHAALARHLVALCWEASGAMAALVDQTCDYVRQRVQFGQPLAQFQAVAHRVAEMAVCSEEALAACELAALRIDAGASDAMELASMAKTKVGRESRFVAQQAVQLHGAMGVSEELPVASYFRMLTAFGQQGGSTAAHARQFGAAQLQGALWRESRTLGAAGRRED